MQPVSLARYWVAYLEKSVNFAELYRFFSNVCLKLFKYEF